MCHTMQRITHYRIILVTVCLYEYVIGISDVCNIFANIGFSRDVTRSRACLVTLLIRHFGGQASAVVCAVRALQCIVYTSYQPACGVVCLWML